MGEGVSMPINPNIALGVQPMQIQQQDPSAGMNALARMMQISGAMDQQKVNALQYKELQRGLEETKGINALWAGAVGPDGTIDEAKLYSGAAAGGFGSKIPSIQKQLLEAREARFKVQNEAAKGYDRFRRTVGAHAATPNPSREAVAADVQGLVASGSMDGAVAQRLLAGMPTDPQQLTAYLQQAVTSQMDPKDMLTVFAPKPTEVKDGQRLFYRDTNPNSPTYGQNTGGAPVQMQMTPGEVATDRRAGAQLTEQKRHNGMVEQSASQAVTYQQDANGNYVALPSKVAPGQVVRPMAVAAPGGMQPLQGKPSAAVEKELTGLSQQRAIVKGAIDAVKANPEAFSFARGAATMAGPMSESVAGRYDSDAQRQARSYLFNNVSKVINERAGAAQSAQELARLRAFLPGELDNAEQIVSKMEAFDKYLNDMEAGTRGKPAAPAAPAGGLPPMSAIDAELARRAGKK
jgi:hypothetical protein